MKCRWSAALTPAPPTPTCLIRTLRISPSCFWRACGGRGAWGDVSNIAVSLLISWVGNQEMSGPPRTSSPERLPLPCPPGLPPPPPHNHPPPLLPRLPRLPGQLGHEPEHRGGCDTVANRCGKSKFLAIDDSDLSTEYLTTGNNNKAATADLGLAAAGDCDRSEESEQRGARLEPSLWGHCRRFVLFLILHGCMLSALALSAATALLPAILVLQ